MFLLELDSESLNMSEEEFQKRVEETDTDIFNKKAGLYKHESISVKQFSKN